MQLLLRERILRRIWIFRQSRTRIREGKRHSKTLIVYSYRLPFVSMHIGDAVLRGDMIPSQAEGNNGRIGSARSRRLATSDQ